MHNPICFALDVSSHKRAQEFADRLEPYVGAFKVGLELFIASGSLVETPLPIVLDLKLHDIPETVARAIKAGGDIGAKYMTLHIQQRAALEAAMKAAEPFGITLLGVTVLTSMTGQDCEDLRFDRSPISGRVQDLGGFAYEAGLRGFVCSPQEVKALKAQCPEAFFLVPGVRSAGSSIGDQQRVGTPAQAVQDGASLIVVGRPIRDAQNPVEAAQAILCEVQTRSTSSS